MIDVFCRPNLFDDADADGPYKIARAVSGFECASTRMFTENIYSEQSFVFAQLDHRPRTTGVTVYFEYLLYTVDSDRLPSLSQKHKQGQIEDVKKILVSYVLSFSLLSRQAYRHYIM